MFINSKENIPSIGDYVTKLFLSKNKDYIKVCFDSGKFMIVQIKKQQIVHSKKPKIGNKKVVKSVPSEYSNGPNDTDYRSKVLETLNRIGRDPSLKMEDVKMLQEIDSMDSESSISDEEFKQRASIVAEQSESRASRLAEQYARSTGAKLEKDFGGKDSIKLG